MYSYAMVTGCILLAVSIVTITSMVYIMLYYGVN